MTGGFRAYAEVLSTREARRFSMAGFVARLPISMTALGIVLLVSMSTGSFGRAGLITGCATIVGAIAAPLWGRVMDRIGQARVLVLSAVICNVSLILLVVSVQARSPLALTLLTAVGVGLGFSSAGSAVRARWAHRLSGSPLLNTAYAVEAVVDEVVFIVGPVLATLLATTVHPAAALAACVVLGLVGAFALAAQRGSEPPVAPRTGPEHRSVPLSAARLLPIVVGCASLGALFGGMEVVVVAFATEAGVLKWAGVLVMMWAAGSLISGVLTGTIQWTVSPARRFGVGSVLLALSMLPLPFVDSPVLMALLLSLSGLAIAPTLIATVAVTQDAVPVRRLAEALGWTSTGMAGGVALGAASIGQVVDRWDAQAGFLGIVVIGVLLALSAIGVRSSAHPLEPVTADAAATVSGSSSVLT